ncbi:MAG TPA: GntR family transcriptional regulator [Methylomirabilota bacterium]|nr:GntR family transcriptional regulator [Methylomirabilota bacterium]
MSQGATARKLPKSPVEALSFERVEAPSRSDRVYRQLRERLMRGILKPHQRLRIRELAAALGTSETPVREAIFQLVRDGGLELKPHHYIRVRRLSLAEYFELRDIRLLLEPLAAERALEHIDDAMIDRLAAIHKSLIAAERSRDYYSAIQANFDFHFGIYLRSGMPQLIGLLENLWIQVGPMLNHLYPHGHPTYDGRHQHEHVLKALRTRDGAALSAAIRNDMLEGGRYFVRHLEKLEREAAEAAAE